MKKILFCSFMFFFITFRLFASENEELTDAILPRIEANIASQLYTMLEVIDQTFALYDIHYWATCGTLLGAVRHGGIIPWDGDIDIAIFEKDLTKLLTLKTEFAKKGLVLHPMKDYLKVYPSDGTVILKENGSEYPWKYPFIDIMPMEEKEGKVSYLSNRLRSRLESKDWFSSSDLCLPLQKVPFGPLSIPIPNHPHEYLERLYGNDYLEIAYSDYDHAKEKRKEKVKVKLVERTPAPFLK